MFRALLLGSVLSSLLMAGPASAQQTATGGTTSGTTGAAATGAPISLLNGQGGLSQGLQRTLPGTQSLSGARLEGTDLSTEGTGVAGAIVTTPTPMNAAGSVLDGTVGQGAIATTPSPFDDAANTDSSSTVPPLSGTTVPALGGDAGTGLSTRGLPRGVVNGSGFGQGNATDAGGGLLARRLAGAGQVQQGQQQAGPQIIVLSGSVLRGVAGTSNVIVLPGSAANAVQPRGLARRLGQMQAVLQGTTQTPSVITFAPAPGNVLIVQGSGIPASGRNGSEQGRLRAQIVELPAD